MLLQKKQPLNIVGLVRKADKIDVLRSALQEIPGANVDVRRQTLADAAPHLVNGHTPDILFIDLGDEENELAALTTFVGQAAGKTAVLASAEHRSAEDVRHLMRAGVTDFITQPLKREEIIAAVNTALISSRQAIMHETTSARGRVVSFMRCAGGMGATTLAVEAACDLQTRLLRGSDRACYLDFDLQFGNAALLLDIVPTATVLNVIEHLDGLDHTLLSKSFGRHRSGLEILAAPRQVVPLEAMTPKIAHRVIDVAREEHQIVFVDLPLAWCDWTLSILKDSDLVVVVTGLAVPHLDRTTRLLTGLREQGLTDLPIALVATRVPRFWGSDALKQAQEVLGRKIDFCIVKDEQVVQEAHDRGALFSEVSRGCRIGKDIRTFANGIDARMTMLNEASLHKHLPEERRNAIP
jgi:pilus assembly protein CpaE